MPQSLVNKQVGLWFFGQGFRNRVAFEIGARAMGASVSYIPGELGIHEPLEDIGHYLNNLFSLLMVRAKKHDDLLALSNDVNIPIVNARTNYNHPCEILGDMQFIRRYRGSLDGLNVVFVGEVTNLCMSWFEAAVSLLISVTQVGSADYLAEQELLDTLNAGAVGKISASAEIDPLLPQADLIYTDCWPHSDIDLDRQRIQQLFLPYQVTGDHLRSLHDQAMFLPCHRLPEGRKSP